MWCKIYFTDFRPRQKRSWSFRHIHLREKLWNVLLLCLSPCEHYSRVWSPLISPGSGHPGQCPCLWSWFLCMTQSGCGTGEQKKYFLSRIKNQTFNVYMSYNEILTSISQRKLLLILEIVVEKWLWQYGLNFTFDLKMSKDDKSADILSSSLSILVKSCILYVWFTPIHTLTNVQTLFNSDMSLMCSKSLFQSVCPIIHFVKLRLRSDKCQMRLTDSDDTTQT